MKTAPQKMNPPQINERVMDPGIRMDREMVAVLIQFFPDEVLYARNRHVAVDTSDLPGADQSILPASQPVNLATKESRSVAVDTSDLQTIVAPNMDVKPIDTSPAIKDKAPAITPPLTPQEIRENSSSGSSLPDLGPNVMASFEDSNSNSNSNGSSNSISSILDAVVQPRRILVSEKMTPRPNGHRPITRSQFATTKFGVQESDGVTDFKFPTAFEPQQNFGDVLKKSNDTMETALQSRNLRSGLGGRNKACETSALTAVRFDLGDSFDDGNDSSDGTTTWSLSFPPEVNTHGKRQMGGDANEAPKRKVGRKKPVADKDINGGNDTKKKERVEKPKLHVCAKCGMACSTPQGLRVHNQSKHDGIRYQCRVCHATYNTRMAMGHHIHTTHLGYSTKDCVAQFSI